MEIWKLENKRVLEVGSKYVNGSARPFIERLMKLKEYVGINIKLASL